MFTLMTIKSLEMTKKTEKKTEKKTAKKVSVKKKTEKKRVIAKHRKSSKLLNSGNREIRKKLRNERPRT